MHIRVKITNFGKLRDAEVELKNLTFFAGPNNLGKSYVSRIVYSMFSIAAISSLSNYYTQLLEQMLNNIAKHNASADAEKWRESNAQGRPTKRATATAAKASPKDESDSTLASDFAALLEGIAAKTGHKPGKNDRAAAESYKEIIRDKLIKNFQVEDI